MTTPFAGFQDELGRLVATFEKGFKDFTAPEYSEARLREDFLNPLFRALGWDMENKLGLVQSQREVEIESRTDVEGRAKRADYLFRVENRERFVCEAKKPREVLSERYAFQTKRYAWNKGLPLAVLTDFEEIKIYVVGGKPHIDRADEGLWKTWNFRQFPLVAQELWDLLARERVAAGSIETLLDSLPKAKPAKGKARQQWLIRPERTKGLDQDFLEYLDEQRRALASDLLNNNPREDILADGRINEAAQRILDRLLFLRICEDRDIDTGCRLAKIVEIWRRAYGHEDQRKLKQGRLLLKEETGEYKGAAPRESLWWAVVTHLRALDRRPPGNMPFFNGNLFKPHFSEDLRVGDQWLCDFIEEISADESPYLFSVIPVEILGSVYERFLGKVVRPQGRGVTIEEKPEVRKAGGVYYTPRYIVNYIVEQTVGRQLDAIAAADKAFAGFDKKTRALRLLDPACGSGSFLIRAFERVCEHYQRRFTARKDDRKPERCWTDPITGDVHLTVDLKRRILRDNIYGVDLDAQAVEVTQLSLYLKMLEGEDRTSIARQRELFRGDDALLPPLEDNIKHGNSLIASDFSLVPEDLVRVHAFDWDVQFAEIMKAGGFDAVIGNPPYIPIETMEEGERSYYQSAYPQVARKFDTSIVFILRALRLAKSSGFVGYISSVTWETGENFSILRKHMFTEHGVCEVVNLPFDTFKDAYVDTGVYILRGKPSQTYRICRYPKKAKITSLADAKFTNVDASLTAAPDYRLVLDPNAQGILVRASRSPGFKSLGEITKSTQGLAGDRFKRSDSARSAEWYPFGEDAQAYRYELVVKARTYAFMRDHQSLKQFYEAEPKILIRRIINRQDRLDASYCDKQMVFKKDINPFVLSGEEANANLVLGVINSRLLSYLYVNTSAIATKDDFRQTTLAELRRLPVPVLRFDIPSDRARHDKLVELVDKMLALTPKLRAETNESKRKTLQNAADATDRQIDRLVYELYGLTEEEIRIVEGGNRGNE